MKSYNVYVAVQRLIDETGGGLNVWEIIEVKEIEL